MYYGSYYFINGGKAHSRLYGRRKLLTMVLVLSVEILDNSRAFVIFFGSNPR